MIPFLKMNGAGNDFVIFDARKQPLAFSPAEIQQIADRKNATTKGCDQMIVLEPSANADVFMRIYNADGSQVNSCGNATRCVADILEKELGRLPVTIETNAAILQGIKKDERGFMLVDMGKPKMNWQEIPLALPIDKSIALVKQMTGLAMNPYFVSMGNPHAVFFLDFNKRHDAVDGNLVDGFLDKIGPMLEQAKDIFPEGANISVAVVQVEKSGAAKLTASTWERGAGFTAACGTAACAMLAAANRLDKKIRAATILFNNSKQEVNVELDANDHVLLSGAVEKEFEGTLEL